MTTRHEVVRSGRRANFFIIENAFIDDWAGVLGPIAIAVYCCLWRHADKLDSTFIGTPKLAEKLKLSPRAMQRAIKTLADHNLIRVVRTMKPVRQTVYHMRPVPSPAKGLSSMPLFDSTSEPACEPKSSRSEAKRRRKAGDCTGARVEGHATTQSRGGDCTGADLLMEQDPFNKTNPSPDGAGKKPTSTPARSRVRGHGKSSTKNCSGDSSTIQESENSAGASAAKLSSPGELILTPLGPAAPEKSRHVVVERFIKSKYQDANGVTCAWNGRAGKALKNFLDAHASWTTETIEQCVVHRFKSDGIALAEDPVYWIPQLASYLQGPKDKYGKIRAELAAAAAPQTKAPRAVENVPPPIAQPDKLARAARWKNPEVRAAAVNDESPNFLEEPRAIGSVQ